MLNCQQTTSEASRLLDGQLPWGRRLQVYMHLAICVHCRLFRKQFRLAAETAAQQAKQPASTGEVKKIMENLP